MNTKTESAKRLAEATEGDVIEFKYKSRKQVTGGGVYRIASITDSKFEFEDSEDVWTIDDSGRVKADWDAPVSQRFVIVQKNHSN